MSNRLQSLTTHYNVTCCERVNNMHMQSVNLSFVEEVDKTTREESSTDGTPGT